MSPFFCFLDASQLTHRNFWNFSSQRANLNVKVWSGSVIKRRNRGSGLPCAGFAVIEHGVDPPPQLLAIFRP